jgi:hypothetical protein
VFPFQRNQPRTCAGRVRRREERQAVWPRRTLMQRWSVGLAPPGPCFRRRARYLDPDRSRTKCCEHAVIAGNREAGVGVSHHRDDDGRLPCGIGSVATTLAPRSASSWVASGVRFQTIVGMPARKALVAIPLPGQGSTDGSIGPSEERDRPACTTSAPHWLTASGRVIAHRGVSIPALVGVIVSS